MKRGDWIFWIAVAGGVYLAYRWMSQNCPQREGGICGLYNSVFGQPSVPVSTPSTVTAGSTGTPVSNPVSLPPATTFTPGTRQPYYTSADTSSDGTTAASHPAGGHR